MKKGKGKRKEFERRVASVLVSLSIRLERIERRAAGDLGVAAKPDRETLEGLHFRSHRNGPEFRVTGAGITFSSSDPRGPHFAKFSDMMLWDTLRLWLKAFYGQGPLAADQDVQGLGADGVKEKDAGAVRDFGDGVGAVGGVDKAADAVAGVAGPAGAHKDQVSGLGGEGQ
jgi:hypothetical protein